MVTRRPHDISTALASCLHPTASSSLRPLQWLARAAPYGARSRNRHQIATWLPICQDALGALHSYIYVQARQRLPASRPSGIGGALDGAAEERLALHGRGSVPPESSGTLPGRVRQLAALRERTKYLVVSEVSGTSSQSPWSPVRSWWYGTAVRAPRQRGPALGLGPSAPKCSPAAMWSGSRTRRTVFDPIACDITCLLHARGACPPRRCALVGRAEAITHLGLLGLAAKHTPHAP